MRLRSEDLSKAWICLAGYFNLLISWLHYSFLICEIKIIVLLGLNEVKKYFVNVHCHHPSSVSFSGFYRRKKWAMNPEMGYFNIELAVLDNATFFFFLTVSCSSVILLTLSFWSYSFSNRNLCIWTEESGGSYLLLPFIFLLNPQIEISFHLWSCEHRTLRRALWKISSVGNIFTLILLLRDFSMKSIFQKFFWKNFFSVLLFCLQVKL